MKASGRKRLEEHTPVAALGRVIRTTRRGRFSLDELAEKSGVSAGLISQIERGLGNPSVMTLTKLAYALDLSIGSFFNQSRPDGAVVRRDARRKLLMPHADLIYELLTPTLQGRLGMVRTTVAPRFCNEEQPFHHDGEECVHLLHGTLELFVGDSHYLLQEGDAATYNSTLPHWWRNPSSTERAELIAAMCPPSF